MPEDQTIAGHDPNDRDRLLALLDLGFDAPGDDDDPPGTGLEGAGDQIGRYRLVELLGSGGFGNVWLAEQTEPIQRKVALKLIKPGMDSREIIARFEAERQALALMDHPNIARVLDAGTSATGRPYFVLELVIGKPITEHCDELGLGIRGRLELFMRVCHAVQHAHQKAILHRDLKPSNILITDIDGRKVPKVIDFGIAKALGVADEVIHSSLLATRAGVVVGTPDYMSPEQAGSMADVDTRSDIYALGVILYELLTGKTPLAAKGPRLAFDQVLREIREGEPPRPSTCVARCADQEETESSRPDILRLSRALRGDLDRVTMKALEKDRQRRYGTATSLALDIRAYLRGETVSAMAPTWSYRFGKFARRNAAGLVAAGLVATAMIAGTLVSLWQARQAELSRQAAEANRLQSETNRQTAEANLAKTKEAVERFLSRVTDHPKLKEPDFDIFKKSLLADAASFYQELDPRTGDDTSTRSHRAWTLGRLGSLYHQTGEHEKAVAALREAVEIDESLATELPEVPEIQLARAMRINNLSVALRAKGDIDEAHRFKKLALEKTEECYTRNPADLDARQNLALVLANYADDLNVRNEWEKAEHAYNRAMVLQKELAAQTGRPRELQQLAFLQAFTGGASADRGQLAKAEELYRSSFGGYERLILEVPSDPGFREKSSVVARRLGDLLCKMERPDEGLPWLEQGIALAKGLTEEFPKRDDYRLSMANSLTGLARTLRKVGRIPESKAKLEQALEILGKLSSIQPDSSKIRVPRIQALDELASIQEEAMEWAEASKALKLAVGQQKDEFRNHPDQEQSKLAGLQRRLAEADLKAGDAGGALFNAWEMARLTPDAREPWHWTALIGAKGLPIIEASAQPEPNATVYTEHAIKMLRQAVANGFDEIASFPQDEGARSIVLRPEFQALLREDFSEYHDLDRALLKTPGRFTYDYRGDDPGLRRWQRDGKTWTEVQPSGKRTYYVVSAAGMVDGISGTELKNQDGSLTFFLPHPRSRRTSLLVKRHTGLWESLGEIKDAE